MQPLAWDDFRLVRAVADQRSLGGAANLLGVNNSTVFRRLNALEEQLGVRIFERARTGYVLTPAGEEMVSLAHKMAESIVDFERRIAGQDVRPSGELRVTTTDAIFKWLAAPVFATFQEKYPEISLELLIDNRILNLSRRDADVAIRASTEPPQTLFGRRVSDVKWGAYAAKSYLKQSGLENASVETLTRPPVKWIGSVDGPFSSHSMRWVNDSIHPDCVHVRANSVSVMADAVAAGLGIGMIPRFVGEAQPDLVRINTITPRMEMGLWILTHPDLKKAARVRAFLDFFGTELAKKRRQIEGDA